MYLLDLLPELRKKRKLKRQIWIGGYLFYEPSIDKFINATVDGLTKDLTTYDAIQNDWELVKEPEELKKIQKLDEGYHGLDEVINKINEVIDILNSKEGSKK